MTPESTPPIPSEGSGRSVQNYTVQGYIDETPVWADATPVRHPPITNMQWLAALVGIGVALGCDYPTAHLIISESTPSRIRGRMVLGAFAFQAVGALVGTAVGFVILFENPDITAWRWMYASTLVLVVPVVIGRFFIVQSPLWLMFRGRVKEAEIATERLLLRQPPDPQEVVLHHAQARDTRHADQREKAPSC
jgi:MFS family permease